ncbi:hypothetical protein [Aurantiacibacter gangjinensis]|uniref:Uncharacterized protein n=1 Tax=Aurantiacibacter gangjinensis TaxID=502682 RepID=A0A0G9MQY7_9SPHN|nr:hypothetical protein [Aurantiacibacter gangjinensis]APE27719.1 hypothetical protein BMF35_a0890 [Aurantiacibacter gangjinensis]KLE31723.1 hypothetical protein AAW01_09440 [Aurantiacibacter gangjinensis]
MDDTIPIENHIMAFLKATLYGALASGGWVWIFTVPLGLFEVVKGEWGGLLIAILPLLVSGAGTLAGMFALAMPITAVLQAFDAETRFIYSWAGLIGGFFAPIAVVAAFFGYDRSALALGLFGALAGWMAGMHWGDWRQYGALGKANRFAEDFA